MLWEPERKFQIHFDFQSFSAELRSTEVELYILKSKFGCGFPKSNLSYCHVNVALGTANRSTHWFRYAHISESPTNIVKCLKSNILNLIVRKCGLEIFGVGTSLSLIKIGQ